MKTILLFFASLLTATTWAHSNKTLALYAKVNETCIPLSGTRFSKFEDLSVFSYGDPSKVPAEFILNEDNYAFGPNHEKLGFSEPFIVFGHTVRPIPLKLDSGNKILNGRFYSCQVANTKVHKIFYEMKNLYGENCFEVDIFLLPYKPKRKSGFSHGDGSEAPDVPSKNGHTINTENSWIDNTMNFGKPLHSLGPITGRTNSKFGNVNRVHPYYSSSSGYGINTPTNNKVSTYYSKEEIYYHHESNPGAVERLQKEKYNPKPVAQDKRYHLYADINGYLKPLSARLNDEHGDYYSTMCYGHGLGDPIKFKIDGFYALSVETFHYGYLGIRNHKLSFGPNIPPTDLMLDEHMRLRNEEYQSCYSINYSQVITTDDLTEDCFDVNIYLLPIHEVAAKSLMQETLKKKKKALLGNEVLRNSGNEVWLADSELNLSPVTQGTPYVLHAKIKGSMVPLGASLNSRGRVEYRTISHGPGVGAPIQFQMKGTSAISINTFNNGYLRIHDQFLAFGRDLEATDLMLGKDGRLHNAEYLSCVTFEGYYSISTVWRFLPCEKVEIYLLNHTTETVTDMKGVPLPEKENSSDDNEVSLRQHEGTHPKSLASDFDYVLFVQLGAALVGLGTQHYFHNGIHYNVMCHGTDCGEPVHFEIVEESAISLFREYGGYLAIFQRKLTFGPANSPIDLMLDEDMRLRNADYFSCDTEISSERIDPSCFKVKLYLLHPSSVNSNTLTKIGSKKNTLGDRKKTVLGSKVVEKDENEVTWKKSPGKDMVFDKNPESNSSTST